MSDDLSILAERVRAHLLKGIEEFEIATGESLVPAPGVLDMGFRDLTGMAVQAQAYGLAYDKIRVWMRPDERKPLGSVLKTIPRSESEQIRAHLRVAGVLDD